MSMVALEGLKPWLFQRLSALYMIFYTVYVLVYWSFFNSLNYTSWYGWLSADLNQILLGLFYLSLLLHAWIGVRDVLLDYIKPFLLRLLLLFAVAVFLLGSAIWLFKILIMVNT